jgi:hypothetical protein
MPDKMRKQHSSHNRHISPHSPDISACILPRIQQWRDRRHLICGELIMAGAANEHGAHAAYAPSRSTHILLGVKLWGEKELQNNHGGIANASGDDDDMTNCPEQTYGVRLRKYPRENSVHRVSKLTFSQYGIGRSIERCKLWQSSRRRILRYRHEHCRNGAGA